MYTPTPAHMHMVHTRSTCMQGHARTQTLSSIVHRHTCMHGAHTWEDMHAHTPAPTCAPVHLQAHTRSHLPEFLQHSSRLVHAEYCSELCGLSINISKVTRAFQLGLRIEFLNRKASPRGLENLASSSLCRTCGNWDEPLFIIRRRLPP